MATDDIIAQFAYEAAFLWSLRSIAVAAPHISLGDLAALDERLEAQIDGLRVAGDAGWASCRNLLEGDCSEAIFAAAVLAFENGEQSRVWEVIDAVRLDSRRSRILISALGWLAYERALPHIEVFLSDQSSFHRYIGIAASAIHRRHPGHNLASAACDPAPLLKARALRAYGELGRSRELVLSTLQDDLTSNDDEIRFAAAWSTTLAGSIESIEVLIRFVEQKSVRKEKALQAALRRMDRAAAISWHKELAESPSTIRLAVIGTGIIGDPILVPWLIDQMHAPSLARVAGEAFTMITGVDVERAELEGTRPEGFAAGPSDDPEDDNVAMDADQDLPWPDQELTSAWWNKNKGNYQSGIRHLLGKTLSVDHLRQILRTGFQRQRSAAALELAMLNPGEPLFEVRAPAFRQNTTGRNQ